MRDDGVVLLEGAPNGRHEPAGSGEHVGEVHILEVRLRVAPGFGFEQDVCFFEVAQRLTTWVEPRRAGERFET